MTWNDGSISFGTRSSLSRPENGICFNDQICIIKSQEIDAACDAQDEEGNISWEHKVVEQVMEPLGPFFTSSTLRKIEEARGKSKIIQDICTKTFGIASLAFSSI